jgi:hypothetical protein
MLSHCGECLHLRGLLIDARPAKTSFSDGMKTLNALLLALALVANPSLFGEETKATNPDESNLKAIAERENKYTDGLLHRNFEELASVFADTYVNTSPSGQLRSKAEFLAALKADTSRISEIKESEKQTQLYGDTAVVTVNSKGEPPTSGSSKTVNGFVSPYIHVPPNRGVERLEKSP